MFHHKILEKFKKIFPLWANDVYEWKNHGKNTIKVKLTSLREELVFVYYGDKRWLLHTDKFE